jgi:hypothetical protein
MLRYPRGHPLVRWGWLLAAVVIAVSQFLMAAPAAKAASPQARLNLAGVGHPLHHVPASSPRTVPVATQPRAAQLPGNPSGYLPCDVSNAYRLNGSGLTGAGSLIALVDAHDQPTIVSDLRAFDQASGLPDPPSFDVYQPGGPPGSDPGWAAEITIDVEWAHAMAPGAGIALIEEPGDGLSLPVGNGKHDLTDGVWFATRNTLAGVNADIVSMSWGLPESDLSATTEAQLEGFFPSTNAAGRPVTYLGSAGDSGHQATWPSIATGVIGVGGTSIASWAYGYPSFPGQHFSCSPATSPGVSPANETVWGNQCTAGGTPPCLGTGGGPSLFETRPTWQSIAPGTTRAADDVAMEADPQTGVDLVQKGAWADGRWGGTSLAAPMWAGIAALLNEERRLREAPNLNVTNGSSWVYSTPASSFNDITSGSSPATAGDACVGAAGAASCSAASGYDLMTGRGSPAWPALLDGVSGTGPGPTRGDLVSMAPARIMDTRTGLGGRSGPLQPEQTFSLQVGGQHGIAPDAAAVTLNVGVTDTPGPGSGYILLYPCGQPRPLASTLNFNRGQTVAILTQTQLGNGCLNIYVSGGAANVFIDAQGYFTASASGQSGLYDPLLTPYRTLDTRTGLGGHPRPLGQGESLELQLAGNPAGSSPAIPAGASTILLNLTAVSGSAPGSYLSVYPAASGAVPCPANHSSSNLNFAAGQILANRVAVRVGTGGNVCIYNDAGSVNVIVDLAGWYSGGQSGDTTGMPYSGWMPTRAYDSRRLGQLGPGNGQAACLAVAMPPAASGVVSLNLTGLGASDPTYLQVYPTGAPPNPPTSDLNLLPGGIVSNLMIARLGDNHSITVCNSAGTVDFFVDVSGGYS